MGQGQDILYAKAEKILDGHNLPHRDFQDEGLFKVVEVKWAPRAGETETVFKTFVYTKGLFYIRHLIEIEAEAKEEQRTKSITRAKTGKRRTIMKSLTIACAWTAIILK
jgi:hypothetical protein